MCEHRGLKSLGDALDRISNRIALSGSPSVLARYPDRRPGWFSGGGHYGILAAAFQYPPQPDVGSLLIFH